MLWLAVEKNAGTPIIRQIYGQIREKILGGELSAGEPLPSTRELAHFLQVSRNVVLEAYEMLTAEGYIVSKPNNGTFVAEGAFLEALNEPDSGPKETPIRTEEKAELIDFRSGIPALDLLPRKKWARIQNELVLDASESVYGYGTAEGRLELRKVICQYLQRTRGVDCHPEQIIITTGSMQSFSLLASLLLTGNLPYITEDPLHVKIRNSLATASSSIYPVPVDDFGIRTGLLPKDLKPAMILVTPSHQYPLGGNLPIQRRIELIQYARSKECYIIEDDYDSEFRYEGLPVSSLQGLDPDRVIYVGTFSKVLFPSIRLGYIILPWALVEECREVKRRSDYFTNVLKQLTMARFIEDRLLERHINRMKKIYRQRRDSLIECLRREFPGLIEIKGGSTGLHLVVGFVGQEFTEEKERALEGFGVRIYPVAEHFIQPDHPRNLIVMGYSHLSPERIEEGVKRLRDGLAICR